MDSTHLFYFKTIAESESLTKAARKLYISQPALSKSLANLEDELGTPLFNRTGGRLYLNDNGKILLQYVYQLDDLFKSIETRFQDIKDNEQSLRIAASGNYFSFVMKDYFLYDTKPLNLKFLEPKELFAALLDNAVDLIIGDEEYMNKERSQEVKRIPILQEQLLLMVPKDHELASKSHVTLKELENYRIMRASNNIWLYQILERNNVSLNLSWTLDSGTWNYYWTNYEGEIPLCFDTSASFVTHEQLQKRRQKCRILKVDGNYTTRMLYVWYLAEKETTLHSVLNSVKYFFQSEN
ncbi:MAG: LysR family transcriptional regulator [Eubacterium sp.]|jgi:DNA-binding transcriptional LysR family regulator|nr:LysR family transcriptional regulator [Eubacterium sp.]